MKFQHVVFEVKTSQKLHKNTFKVHFIILKYKVSYFLKKDLMHIFDFFLPQLFALPEPSDPYNILAANLLMASPENYKMKVKEYIQKYATEEALAGHAQEGHTTLEPNPLDCSSISDLFDF